MMPPMKRTLRQGSAQALRQDSMQALPPMKRLFRHGSVQAFRPSAAQAFRRSLVQAISRGMPPMLPPMKRTRLRNRPLPPMALNRTPPSHANGLPPCKPTSGLRSKRMNWLMGAKGCIGVGAGRKTAVGVAPMVARLARWQTKNGLASIGATAHGIGGG